MKLSIVVPAHNEQERIEKTVRAYHEFFDGLRKKNGVQCELMIVLNGCTDNTNQVVARLRETLDNIVMIETSEAGKGLAIIQGFRYALERGAEVIGFVDADMATKPHYFYDLVVALDAYDGVIGSRYMPGAQVYPPRPAIKRWGSKIFYEPIIWLLFGMHFYDYQCGAKIFKRRVVERVLPHLHSRQWAFDVELLYAIKRAGFSVKEVPTVWHDQEGSKLRLSAGLRMICSLIMIRLRYLWS